MTSLSVAKKHDHILFIYHTPERMLESALTFLKNGLNCDESIMIITDKFSKEQITSEMHKKWNIDIKDLEEKKILHIPTAKDWYFPNEEIDEKRMISLWKRTTEQAISNGKRGLRVFADTGDIFTNSLHDKFHNYECKLPQIFDFPFTAACAYELSSIDKYSSTDFVDLVDHHVLSVTQ